MFFSSALASSGGRRRDALTARVIPVPLPRGLPAPVLAPPRPTGLLPPKFKQFKFKRPLHSNQNIDGTCNPCGGGQAPCGRTPARPNARLLFSNATPLFPRLAQPPKRSTRLPLAVGNSVVVCLAHKRAGIQFCTLSTGTSDDSWEAAVDYR